MKRSPMRATHPILRMALTALISISLQSAAIGENSSNALQSGMAEFNAGKYSDAAGHFGLALTTEFNNSVLHYYLGNCYVRMNQRDSAVREFRIAYALDPEKDVGKFAKQALAGLNADIPAATATSAAKGSPPASSGSPGSPGAPGVAQPGSATPGVAQPGSASPGGATELKPTIGIGPGGKIVELPPKPMPSKPSPPQVIPARSPYILNRNDESFKSALELQRAAENLHELLIKQAKPGEHHLIPAGTNLYIRNYQTAPDASKGKATDHH